MPMELQLHVVLLVGHCLFPMSNHTIHIPTPIVRAYHPTKKCVVWSCQRIGNQLAVRCLVFRWGIHLANDSWQHAIDMFVRVHICDLHKPVTEMVLARAVEKSRYFSK